MPVLVYGFLFLTAAFTGPVLAVANAQPVTGSVSLVIGSPWKSSMDIITETDGQLVGPYSLRIGALAASDDPEFINDLKSAGAWFILDGDRLAQMCGVTT